jgi:hypothetical protein
VNARCPAPTWEHFSDVAGAYPSAYQVSMKDCGVNLG